MNILVICIVNGSGDDDGDSAHRDTIKELLMKVKSDEGFFDFSKFKKLYTTKYINEELRNQSST